MMQIVSINIDEEITKMISQISYDYINEKNIRDIKHWLKFIELNIVLQLENDMLDEEEAVMWLIRTAKLNLLHNVIKERKANE